MALIGIGDTIPLRHFSRDTVLEAAFGFPTVLLSKPCTKLSFLEIYWKLSSMFV